MKSRSSLSPQPVIVTHVRALLDSSTSRRRRLVFEQYLIPVVGGAISLVLDLNFSEFIGIALLTVSGILAAFFFQLSIGILSRAASWSEGSPPPSRDSTDYALLLEELSANTLYSGLVAILCAAAALGAGISTGGWYERLLVTITVVLTIHLLTTILFVSNRVFFLTRSHTIRARAGRSRQT